MAFTNEFRTYRQMLALMITPMITGLVSFISSLIIIIMIYKSNLKLSTVYRRLVFGVSAFDLIQSLSQAISSMPMPVGSSVGALGNDVTCDIQGLLVAVGINGSLLYSVSLSIYFLAMIRNRVVSERKIKEKLEPYLHAVPILFTLIAAAVLFITNSFNPTGSICATNIEDQTGCDTDPDVECKDQKAHLFISYIFVAFPLLGALIANIVIMCWIWRREYLMEKKNQKYRSGWLTTNASRGRGDISRNTTRNNSNVTPTRNGRGSEALSPLEARLSRPSLASVRRRKEISRRAIAYILCSFLTYIFAFIFRVWPHSGHHPPFALELLRSIFLPLQGLFNIIIYTYPHVMSRKRNNPEYSWLRTFWEVVQSGGDSDQVMVSPRNRSVFGRRATKRKSIRNEPVVIDYDQSLISTVVSTKVKKTKIDHSFIDTASAEPSTNSREMFSPRPQKGDVEIEEEKSEIVKDITSINFE